MTWAASLALVTLGAACVPPSAWAGASAGKPQGGMVSGVALAADKTPLPNHTVQARRLDDGALAASTRTGEAGEFAFGGLAPGDYVIEIVDSGGRIVGMTPALAVAAGGNISVSVTASAAGALIAGTGGGLSLSGLGKLASFAVVGVAGAMAVRAVVATRDVASPSR